MSQALAQSATQLAVSNNGDWDDTQFASVVNSVAQRKVGKSGITTDRLMLKRGELISGTCAIYRNHFPAIYGRTDRLPSEVHDKICTHVDNFIKQQLSRINSQNVISLREYYYANIKANEITQRTTVTSETTVSLETQEAACKHFISQVEKRIKDLESRSHSPKNLDDLKSARAKHVQFTNLLNFIVGEAAYQKKQLAAKSE